MQEAGFQTNPLPRSRATMKVQCNFHGTPRRPAHPSDDAFRVQRRDDTVIATLADGMGAARQGGIAARRSVAMMTDYFLGRPLAWSPRRALAECAAQINRMFFQESQLFHGAPELLCTLSTIALEGGMLYGLNVGDSPVYLVRGGALVELSERHVRSESGLEHVLTRAIGATASLEPHVFETPLEDGDTIILCSDGVTTPLGNEEFRKVATRGVSARTLVAAANAAAEENEELRDDASAVVIEVVERGWVIVNANRPVEIPGSLRIGDTIDDYRLERSLQDGDRVWLARHASGELHVLKFPALDAQNDERRRDAFVREAWQASRIASPDIVRARIPDTPTLRYYVMEYLDAPTLAAVLEAGPLSVEDTLSLGRFLLRVGQQLLRHEIAHGDLKPENILVNRTASGLQFKLLDLGSAAEIFSVTTRAGTASYLAPERFHGGALAERTEIFAIGVTLYRALTRTFPYGEIERYQTPKFDSPPRRLMRLNPAVPSWLDAVIMRALAPEAERRYQRYSEMTFDLDHPEKVAPFYRKHAPLLERDPVLFYKLLSVLLGCLCLFLLWQLNRADSTKPDALESGPALQQPADP